MYRHLTALLLIAATVPMSAYATSAPPDDPDLDTAALDYIEMQVDRDMCEAFDLFSIDLDPRVGVEYDMLAEAETLAVLHEADARDVLRRHSWHVVDARGV